MSFTPAAREGITHFFGTDPDGPEPAHPPGTLRALHLLRDAPAVVAITLRRGLAGSCIDVTIASMAFAGDGGGPEDLGTIPAREEELCPAPARPAPARTATPATPRWPG